MADVAITKSKSITIRGGQIPSAPVIPETPEDPVTLPSTPPHNNLSGLQGGTSTKRFHLNEDEWDAVDNANSPDAGNPFATMADVGGGGGLPPIDGSYASQALMIADQASQTAQYIYFDGTAYWEYLGTTTPSIADYRQISGGGSSDPNKVSYNVADAKTATEKQQARDNIGLDSGLFQSVTTDATINNISRTNNLIIFSGQTAARAVTGALAGLEGETITLYNKSAFILTLADQNSGSLVANRFSFGANYLLNPNDMISLYYDATISRWVIKNRFISRLSPDIKDGNLQFFEGTNNYISILTGASRGIHGFIGGVQFFRLRMNTPQNNYGNAIMDFLNVNKFTTDTIIRIFSSDSVVQFGVLADGNGTMAGRFTQARSNNANTSVRRDELPYNYPETVATAGTINNLSLTNEGIKLLILTAATDLTGVVPVSTATGRELKIEGRNAGGVIIRHESASSTAANRFTLPGAVDLTIANGEVYTFIYTNGRWRRAL